MSSTFHISDLPPQPSYLGPAYAVFKILHGTSEGARKAWEKRLRKLSNEDQQKLMQGVVIITADGRIHATNYGVGKHESLARSIGYVTKSGDGDMERILLQGGVRIFNTPPIWSEKYSAASIITKKAAPLLLSVLDKLAHDKVKVDYLSYGKQYAHEQWQGNAKKVISQIRNYFDANSHRLFATHEGALKAWLSRKRNQELAQKTTVTVKPHVVTVERTFKEPKEIKERSSREGMIAAPKNRKQWPAHLQHMVVPPAWKQVFINPNPKAALQVIGKDKKGRDQYLYSEKFRNTQMAAKFARIKELDNKFESIAKENHTNTFSKDERTRQHAQILQIIMAMGIRPGSDEDTKADKKAFGATTLLGKHVVQSEGKVSLQFTGKKGVDLNLAVENPKLGKMLSALAKEVGPNKKLFPMVDNHSLLEYVHSLDGGGFKTKDFRTLLANRLAAAEINKLEKPTNEKEYKKAVKEVATNVAGRLGHTPTVCLQAYIQPMMFADWRRHAGI